MKDALPPRLYIRLAEAPAPVTPTPVTATPALAEAALAAAVRGVTECIGMDP